jgi:hypothetical protein
LSVISKPIKGEKGNAAQLYSFKLAFIKVFSGNDKFTDSIFIEIPRGWLVKGNPAQKNLGLNFILYSQNVPGIVLSRFTKDGKQTYDDKSPGTIQNGIVVIGQTQKFWVFERHNDPDGDFLPNAAEDSLGTNWLLGKTHTGSYHKTPNDQEFWAEWFSGQLINPATGYFPSYPMLNWLMR